MTGENAAFPAQGQRGLQRPGQRVRVVHIGTLAARPGETLSQRAAAQAVAAAAQVDEQQPCGALATGGIGGRRAKLRRERAACVRDWRERGNDQRERRDNLALPVAVPHRVRIDRLSLPTGIAIPSAGQSSMPTARTASNRARSSASSPEAAIQLPTAPFVPGPRGPRQPGWSTLRPPPCARMRRHR